MKEETTEKKVKSIPKEQYFFPEHQITIEAESQEEAEKQLKERLKETIE